MEERMKFMLLHEDGWTMSDLCEIFGVSRKTGYKWRCRYDEQGMAGLREMSRAPRHHPNAVPAEVEAAILELKRQRPRRGPKKLLRLLQQQQPDVSWPARSTIAALLKRHGLVRPRRRCRKTPPYELPFAGVDCPNAVWSADFKGWFRTGDGQRCDPLTITDNYSRYLLRCQAVSPVTFATVQAVFAGAFREYGLPDSIRTDNGPPFARVPHSSAVGKLNPISHLRLHHTPESCLCHSFLNRTEVLVQDIPQQSCGVPTLEKNVIASSQLQLLRSGNGRHPIQINEFLKLGISSKSDSGTDRICSHRKRMAYHAPSNNTVWVFSR